MNTWKELCEYQARHPKGAYFAEELASNFDKLRAVVEDAKEVLGVYSHIESHALTDLYNSLKALGVIE